MRKHSSRFRLSALLLVFFACAFLLPASRDGDPVLYILAAAVPGVILLLLFFPGSVLYLDRPVLAAGLCLCAFGVLSPAMVRPDDAVSQGMRCVFSVFFLAAGAMVIRPFRPSPLSAAVLALPAMGMLSCPLWLPSVSFSLAEGGIALLMLSVSAFLSVRLRLPALAVSAGGILLLLLQQEPALAIIWGITCVLLFWAVADSMLWSGLMLSCAAGLLAFFLIAVPDTLPPPPDSILPRIAALPLIAAEVPEEAAASSDSLFLLLGEQYGLIVLLCALSLLLLMLLRGLSLALHTRKVFHAAAALGAVLLTGLRALFFLLSATDILPFPVLDYPFLTTSLPVLCSQFFLAGLLSGVSGRNSADLEEDARLAMLAR